MPSNHQGPRREMYLRVHDRLCNAMLDSGEYIVPSVCSSEPGSVTRIVPPRLRAVLGHYPGCLVIEQSAGKAKHSRR